MITCILIRNISRCSCLGGSTDLGKPIEATKLWGKCYFHIISANQILSAEFTWNQVRSDSPLAQMETLIHSFAGIFQFFGVSPFTLFTIAQKYPGESDTVHRWRSHLAGRFGTTSRNRWLQAIRKSCSWSRTDKSKQKIEFLCIWTDEIERVFHHIALSAGRSVPKKQGNGKISEKFSFLQARPARERSRTPIPPICARDEGIRSALVQCDLGASRFWTRWHIAFHFKITFSPIILQNVESNATHDVYVAISLNGIAIFERCSRINADNQLECGTNSRNKFQRKLYANFDWLEIDNLCFSKHSLCVVVRKSESLKAKDNNKVKYKFKMDGRKWVRRGRVNMVRAQVDSVFFFLFSPQRLEAISHSIWHRNITNSTCNSETHTFR